MAMQMRCTQVSSLANPRLRHLRDRSFCFRIIVVRLRETEEVKTLRKRAVIRQNDWLRHVRVSMTRVQVDGVVCSIPRVGVLHTNPADVAVAVEKSRIVLRDHETAFRAASIAAEGASSSRLG